MTPASVPLVREVLRIALREPSSRAWVGVSCLAPGTDQIFAALVLGLGGRLEVILPAVDYRGTKIGPERVGEFDRLLAAAATVTVLDFDRSSRQAYMAASAAMLGAVDTVLAVWDGHPARRHGSTADVVAAARHRGLPTTILWPSGALRHPALTRLAEQDAIAHALNELKFPARRWQVTTHAEYYGADQHTRALLGQLPDGLYPDLTAVFRTIRPLPVPSTADPPAAGAAQPARARPTARRRPRPLA